MNYCTLKHLIRENAPERGYVCLPQEIFRSLIAIAIKRNGLFDEKYYLEKNPDVAAAVKANKISSAADHYFQTGYYENRLPSKILVDEGFYLSENSDVVQAIQRGILKSAQDHFENAGFSEGRLPYKDFSMF